MTISAYHHDTRWWLHLGRFAFTLEVARWRSGLIATWGYGGQEHFCDWTLALPRLLFVNFKIDTPYSWHRLRPFDGKYGAAEREFGFRTLGWTFRFLFGHDPLGNYYSTYGRWAWFRRGICKNLELTLFDARWITGRDRYTRDLLDEREVVINASRWPGDDYQATQKIERITWHNRFRTLTRVDYEWDIRLGERGIPTGTHGKWGDRYDETYGFGAAARDTNDVAALVAEAPAALEKRLEILLRDWPEGMVPEYPDPTDSARQAPGGRA